MLAVATWLRKLDSARSGTVTTKLFE